MGVFEIPIYRLTNEQFEKELEDYVTKSIPYTRKELINQQGEKGRHTYDRVWNQIKANSEYNWKFNEIIGWITIHLNHKTIFGEIFLKKAKRIIKNSRAKISFYDLGFKIPFNQDDKNQKIFKEILNSLRDIQMSKKFKNRYIDKSKFEVLGPYIDWKNLYNFLNK